MTVAAAPAFRDPITFEVFKNGLTGLADEMGVVMLRTCHSPIATQSMDFSTALCDNEGNVLAQGSGMMIHLGTFPDVMRVVLNAYSTSFVPGDVYIFNDMDEAAQHLNDLYLIKPYFMDEQLLGFGLVSTHHVDIGGSVPGSMNVASSEIFQEGLQIPLVRLYEGGELNEAVMDILMRNVRLPDLYAGDLDGMLAAARVGEVGLAGLAKRYSVEGFRQLSQELLDYTERLTRAAILEIPDGVYEFEDWLDDDGINPDGPIPLRVKITVLADTVEVDWAGSAPQVESALNCHITNTRSVTYGVLVGAFQKEILSNQGLYRPITVKAPEGSVVNPRRPAARGCRGQTCFRMVDTLLGAMYKAVPLRIPAGSDGGVNYNFLTVLDRVRGRGYPAVLGGGNLSGWGGRPGLDGIDGISPFGANLAISGNVEVSEQHGHVRVESCGYVTDSGGAGRWRGCLSVATENRVLFDEGTLRARVSRRKIVPYGVAGGKSGTPSSSIVNPGRADEVTAPQNSPIAVKRNDVLRFIHAGGGGYGHPMLRDPQAVLNDVLDEKITVGYARREYGVVIDLKLGCVNEDETAILRAPPKVRVGSSSSRKVSKPVARRP
jgi:N-methylhydantoinase B